jgi:hypothetical protein
MNGRNSTCASDIKTYSWNECAYSPCINFAALALILSPGDESQILPRKPFYKHGKLLLPAIVKLVLVNRGTG